MKAIFLVFPIVALLLAGCNDSSKPGGSNPAAAPADYLKNAAASQQRAVKTIDLAAINKAIESFYVQEGRFPKNLEELLDKDYLRTVPIPPPGVKLVYNPTNGVAQLLSKE